MTTGPGSGGYHWRSEEHVAGWDAIRSRLDPLREAGLRAMVDQLSIDRFAPLRVVDLGAGDGRIASLVLDFYPSASAVLVDFSAPMMAKGEQELARFGDRSRYHDWDMHVGAWPVDLPGPFDAVVSSAAIHHLENDRKRWLARAVMDHLTPGGVFANYDLFRDPNASFGANEIHDRTCASVNEAIGFLNDAGYVEITVTAQLPRPARKGEFALMVGRHVGVQSQGEAAT
jgi:SAM-dependent methyltransferase